MKPEALSLSFRAFWSLKLKELSLNFQNFRILKIPEASSSLNPLLKSGRFHGRIKASKGVPFEAPSFSLIALFGDPLLCFFSWPPMVS